MISICFLLTCQCHSWQDLFSLRKQTKYMEMNKENLYVDMFILFFCFTAHHNSQRPEQDKTQFKSCTVQDTWQKCDVLCSWNVQGCSLTLTRLAQKLIIIKSSHFNVHHLWLNSCQLKDYSLQQGSKKFNLPACLNFLKKKNYPSGNFYLPIRQLKGKIHYPNSKIH